jgi:uncharacterized Ntn-hydrolase superfamily protein
MLHTTFSLTARCPRTGRFGIAVATRVPAVGAAVPHLRAGVGAIATQAWTNPYIGLDGVDLLAQGASADQVLAAVRAWDPDVERRQFAIVDRQGGVAAHTGAETHDHAGHRLGGGFVAAGNLLAGPDVLDAMVEAFAAEPERELQVRLLAALAAGQAAGGDKRGKQSAALKVVDREDYALLDLRVDEHADPIVELHRVYAVWDEVFRPHLAARPTRADLAARAGAERPRLST